MKVEIDVTDEAEAAAVTRAFDHPATRALVLVMGTLLGLPTDRARSRVLSYVQDKLNEDATNAAASEEGRAG